jgi:hypothetical protein
MPFRCPVGKPRKTAGKKVKSSNAGVRNETMYGMRRANRDPFELGGDRNDCDAPKICRIIKLCLSTLTCDSGLRFKQGFVVDSEHGHSTARRFCMQYRTT